ncbi:MAG: Mrp/NBP35 family ATP-binding protein [Gemmatimonadales bacterium]|nr:Mrp/NBP35 family ATP-binding protein [Gemmatimonadales bacterium]
MSESLRAEVLAALARVQNPRLGNDLFSAGMIRDLETGDDGSVSFTFLLAKDDPATLVREARAAVRAVPGVEPARIRIAVVDPAGPAKVTHGPPQGGAGPQSAAAGVPAPRPEERPELGRVIAISSGKGGVGKSTVAANLAIALARQGHRVGLMDADVYGPNMPRMFGVFEKPPVMGGRMQPLAAHGVLLMSLGFLIDRDAPAIWRGPIIQKIIQQFLRDVAWGELDYFIVDMPPGTGDAQLSLVQSTHVSAAVIVTTPQEVAVGDALRGAKMFEKVSVPVIGVVENMAAFTDPETGRRFELFSSGGGARLAEEIGAPLLGSVPLQPGLAETSDRGQPVVVSAPDSPAAVVLREVAAQVDARMKAGAGVRLPVLK